MHGEEVDEDYILKFMDEGICKPMEKAFEDMIQCQHVLQETQFERITT